MFGFNWLNGFREEDKCEEAMKPTTDAK